MRPDKTDFLRHSDPLLTTVTPGDSWSEPIDARPREAFFVEMSLRSPRRPPPRRNSMARRHLPIVRRTSLAAHRGTPSGTCLDPFPPENDTGLVAA